MRRVAPTVGLFFLAPLVAEFLLGNLPITMLPALAGLAPMYGGGALLIREVSRRAGWRWPSILLVAGAYAVLEEGLTTQSLFNPDYVGEHLLRPGFIPALGMGGLWTLFVLTLHVVWSIGTPIALVEYLARGRGSGPWLGRGGLTATAGLFALGIGATTVTTLAMDDFVAGPGQLGGAAGTIVLLVLAAALVGHRARRMPPPNRARAGSGWQALPGAPVVFLVALGAGAAFMSIMSLLDPWPAVAAYLLLDAVVIGLVTWWGQDVRWGPEHRCALAAGALLTYAWHSFLQAPAVPASAAVDHVGDAVFCTGAVVLLVLTARTHLRERAGRVP